MQSLELAAIQLAGSQPSDAASSSINQEENFVKLNENTYISISNLRVQQQQQQANGWNKTLDLLFPNPSSMLGTKWMNSQQRFTLHLQTDLRASLANANNAASASGGQQQDEQVGASSGKFSCRWD